MRRHAKTDGYALIELLVTMAMVGVIAGSVVGVYQVSQDIYTRASSLEAAQLGARASLDRMANELRTIGSFWFGAPGAGNAIVSATPTNITFMANVDDLSVVNDVEAAVPPGSQATGNTVPLSLTTTQTADAFRVYTTNPGLNNDFIYIANGGRREVRQIGGTVIDSNTLTLASALSSAYPAGSLVRDVKRITYALNAAARTLTRAQGGSGAIAVLDDVSGLTLTYFDTAGGALGTNPTLSAIREIQIDLTVQGADGSPRRMTTRVRPRSLPS